MDFSPGMKSVAPAATVTLPAPDACSGRKTPASQALPCQLAYVLTFAGLLGIRINTWTPASASHGRLTGIYRHIPPKALWQTAE